MVSKFLGFMTKEEPQEDPVCHMMVSPSKPSRRLLRIQRHNLLLLRTWMSRRVLQRAGGVSERRETDGDVSVRPFDALRANGPPAQGEGNSCSELAISWIPAFAGMTERRCVNGEILSALRHAQGERTQLNG